MILYGLFINEYTTSYMTKSKYTWTYILINILILKRKKEGAIKKTLTESWLEFFIAFDSTKFTASNE